MTDTPMAPHSIDMLSTETALRDIYAEPAKPVVEKVFPGLDQYSRRFIELSPFFCIGSSRPDGLGDVSPRGGEPGFVHAIDDTHIAFPDRPSNNRLDTLTNIVHQPAVALLFFLPGVEEMPRLNGVASITTEETLMARPKGAFPTLGQIARDQFKSLIPAKVIDFALGRDAKNNLY